MGLTRKEFIRKYKAFPECLQCVYSDIYVEYVKKKNNEEVAFKTVKYVRCRKLNAVVASGYGMICEYFER